MNAPIEQDAGNPTYTPLLMVACNAITEIVESITSFHPHSIEHVSEDEQNILNLAVKHRQKEKEYREQSPLNNRQGR